MAIDIGKEMRDSGHPDAPKDPRAPRQQVVKAAKVAGQTFRELQRKNRRRSLLLAAALVVVFGALGSALGATAGSWILGLVAGAAFAGVQFAFARTAGPALVMRAVGARPLADNEDLQLHNVVEELAIAAGIPKPKIYIVEEDSPNAFATGFSPDKAAVGITTALREQLNRNELQAVLAHELGHIKNGDSGYMVLMSILVGSVVMLSDAVLRSRTGIHVVGRNRSSGKGGAPIIILALVLAILAPILSYVIQAAVSREREYLADATAVELTRHPEALVSALKKLTMDPAKFESANRATQHLFIVNPLKAQRLGGGTFASHPPLEQRIARLEELYV